MMADPPDLTTIFAPLTQLLSFQQLETLIYAYVPTRLERYIEKTGIYSVDTFLINAIVTIFLILTRLAFYTCQSIIQHGAFSLNLRRRQQEEKGVITVVVDALIQDDYRSNTNVYHQALCKVLSEQAQMKSQGMYHLKPVLEGKVTLPPIQVVPQAHQEETIEFEGIMIKLGFMDQLSTPAVTSPAPAPPLQPMMHGLPPRTSHPDPPIRITTQTPDATVAILTRYLQHVAKHYLNELERQDRARYEYNGKWTRITTLSSSSSSSSTTTPTINNYVVLDEPIEQLLKQDMASFLGNQTYYERLGLPYRRGYLLYGKPGTGKTSLVLSLAAYLEASLYYMNLSVIQSDMELVAAFAQVPAHAIVVFEDIDTQSPTVLRRKEEETKGYSLGTLLSILDGHTLATGILFIMTTNHKEWLDPALIRPGRMDTHFNLTNTTHYQIRRMFTMTQPEEQQENLDTLFPHLLEKIPQDLIPPSEVMQMMVMYRNDLMSIPIQLDSLVDQHCLTVPHDDPAVLNRLVVNSNDSPTSTTAIPTITATSATMTNDMYPNHRPDLMTENHSTTTLEIPDLTIEDDLSSRRPSRLSFLSRPTTLDHSNSNDRRRLSFLNRPSSRFSFLTRHSTAGLSSRPPSYKQYTGTDQEAQHAADLALCQQLEAYYQQEQAQESHGLLHNLLWKDPAEEPVPTRTIVSHCVAQQFTGFYMAFWVLVFVFIGAVSVFVPDLPPLAKLMWVPLGIYCLGVLVFFGAHQHHVHERERLERAVAEMRRRRLEELHEAGELPMDHYFVIEPPRQEGNHPPHRHGRTTLIPPPPIYHSPTIQISQPT